MAVRPAKQAPRIQQKDVMVIMDGVERPDKLLDLVHFDMAWETDVMPETSGIEDLDEICYRTLLR